MFVVLIRQKECCAFWLNVDLFETESGAGELEPGQQQQV